MRVPSLLGALTAPFVLIACATAVMPSDLGTGEGSDAGGLAKGDGGGYGGGRDTGTSNDDAGTGDDTGTIQETGTTADTSPPPPPPVDSGGGTVTDNCTGTRSTQLATPYDDACDNYYFNVGTSNPCAATGTSCAAFNNTSGFTNFCCYRPPTGSFCYGDYSGVAQCIPK